MKLGLSSAAAPDLDLRQLLQVCERRGLAGVELDAGDAHGLWPGLSAASLADALHVAAESGVRLLGYRAATAAQACSEEAAQFSAALAIPFILPAEDLASEDLRDLAARFARAGARLLLAHGTDPDRVAELRSAIEAAGSEALGLCWDVRPNAENLQLAREVIEAAGDRLGSLRLHGGGPESVSQTGFGVGALMARLTLARFIGSMVLTPSEVRYHQAWHAWLRRNGGWGCGSKTADGTLVQLTA